MSGGHFEYADEHAKNVIFSYYDVPTNVFEDREISQLVWDVFELIHDFDWYRSGDTCEETWLQQKNTFKKKWLGKPRKDRVQHVIDAALEDARKELYKTYGVEVKEDDRTD